MNKLPEQEDYLEGNVRLARILNPNRASPLLSRFIFCIQINIKKGKSKSQRN